MSSRAALNFKFAKGPNFIHARFSIGLLDLNDVTQTLRLRVVLAYYYTPVGTIQNEAFQHIRFENIPPPDWSPHVDFARVFDELIITSESFWYDIEKNRVFGKIVFLPIVQERLDHRRFPYDRQILDLQILIDNVRVKQWEIFDVNEFPPELQFRRRRMIAQAELHAAADSWDLVKLQTFCLDDAESKTCIMHFQIFIQRHSQFYFWNIVFVYFTIIVTKGVIYAFPYTQARYEFALTLALITVAFKFVVSELVPKTSYLTYIDIYMNFGLVLLVMRFLSDFMIQIFFINHLPFGPDAIRATCKEENEINGVSPCWVDFAITLLLFVLWTGASAFMGFCVIFPRIVRPDWDSLNQNLTVSKETTAVLKGSEKWTIQQKKIQYADLEDITSSLRQETLQRHVKAIDTPSLVNTLQTMNSLEIESQRSDQKSVNKKF